MAENTNYSVEIKEASRELTKRERIKFKDYANSTPIDGQGEDFKVTAKDYVILHVINENSDTGEYDILLIIDNDGKTYRTSSKSFIQSFIDIYKEMTADGDDEDFEVGVIEIPSKNYANKSYKKCVLI